MKIINLKLKVYDDEEMSQEEMGDISFHEFDTALEIAKELLIELDSKNRQWHDFQIEILKRLSKRGCLTSNTLYACTIQINELFSRADKELKESEQKEGVKVIWG